MVRSCGPAIYEIRPNTTVGDLVALSGGFTPRADAHQVRVEQLNARGERVVTNLDLTSDAARATSLGNGDFIRVLQIRNTLEGAVTVSGHVYNAQPFAFRAGLRLSDVLRFEDLKPRGDTHYVLIRRELAPDRRIVALSVDLAAALAAPGSEADLLSNHATRSQCSTSTQVAIAW